MESLVTIQNDKSTFQSSTVSVWLLCSMRANKTEGRRLQHVFTRTAILPCFLCFESRSKYRKLIIFAELRMENFLSNHEIVLFINLFNLF